MYPDTVVLEYALVLMISSVSQNYLFVLLASNFDVRTTIKVNIFMRYYVLTRFIGSELGQF